jgi:hypothetical protein
MGATITPEPTPEERAAIERALATLLDPRGGADRGRWWREGIRESVVDDVDGDSEA